MTCTDCLNETNELWFLNNPNRLVCKDCKLELRSK